MDGFDETDSIIRQHESFDAELRPDRLIERHLAPRSLLYGRSHGATPDLGADHAVTSGGDGLRSASFTLADRKERLPERRDGTPMRLVVSGHAEVRSTKRPTRIAPSDTASDAPIQAKDYKLFAPHDAGAPGYAVAIGAA